jgi:hypothetical protein
VVTVAPSASSPLAVGVEDPQAWLQGSSLLDLEDPKLRLRVAALTQLCKNEREKALALYAYVKRLPLARRFKTRPPSAREVYDAGCGDAPDKATLLVALLRIARLPARIRFVSLGGEVLRGIAPGLSVAARPILEVWLHDRWLRTDTFIMDPACMAAARQRLRDRGWEWGYGIHVNGHMLWNGDEDAFLGGVPTECDLMVMEDLGVFHDPRQFRRSRAFRHRFGVLRSVYWALVAPVSDWALRNLRKEIARPVARSRKTS